MKFRCWELSESRLLVSDALTNLTEAFNEPQNNTQQCYTSRQRVRWNASKRWKFELARNELHKKNWSKKCVEQEIRTKNRIIFCFCQTVDSADAKSKKRITVNWFIASACNNFSHCIMFRGHKIVRLTDRIVQVYLSASFRRKFIKMMMWCNAIEAH